MAKFYQVGGCVRDAIIGRPCKDIDYSVEADSFEDMRQAILDLGGRIVQEKSEYHTIRALVPKIGACDYVWCRKEGPYSDGRHPDWVERGSIYDDLARRDFTMNAIAEDSNGYYIDPHDGIGDIHSQIIACVGDPLQKMHEDGLRILRAIRFSAQLGFSIDLEIRGILENPMVSNIIENQKIERVREELEKGFKADTPRMLSLLAYYPYVTEPLFGCGLWLLPTLKGVLEKRK